MTKCFECQEDRIDVNVQCEICDEMICDECYNTDNHEHGLVCGVHGCRNVFETNKERVFHIVREHKERGSY